MRYKNVHLRFPLPEWGRFPAAIKPWLPSRGNFLLVALAFALLLWTQHADTLTGANLVANTATTIAYQGRLASAGGTPLTQTIGMEFRLYNAATGGAPLWTEQWTGSNSVQVSDGLFNVMLGSLTPIPQNVITGNSNLFLGITVGTDSEMSPRVQLGSVPFAVQALTVPDGSIDTGKIANGAVTQAKLGSDVSLVPPSGSITTTMLSDRAVTMSKIDFAVPELVYGGEGFEHNQCNNIIQILYDRGYKNCLYASSATGYAVWHGTSNCSDPAQAQPTVHQRHTLWTMAVNGGTPTYIRPSFADQYPQLICIKR